MINSRISGSSPFDAILDHTSPMSMPANVTIKNILVTDGVIQSFYQTTGLMSMSNLDIDNISFESVLVKQTIISIQQTF